MSALDSRMLGGGMQREKIGVESHIVDLLTAPHGHAMARAKFRILDEGLPENEKFPPGEWLDVGICARVFDLKAIQGKAGLPEEARAEGPEIRATAMTVWRSVDLPLPFLPLGTYAVQAKVYSRDRDHYPRPFDPSNCYAYAATYGTSPTQA